MTDKELLAAAAQAREKGWCRYSHFAVGAALLTEDGTLYTGCNIENAAYPLCTCAERTAIVKAVSEGHRRISAIAIVGGAEGTAATEVCPPCGSCRQLLAEFADGALRVILTDGTYTLDDLLPHRFSL